MNLHVKESPLKKIAQILSIGRAIVHLHLAACRKLVSARNTLELLYILYGTKDMSTKHLVLTPRGHEVFTLTLRGYNDSEIGQELCMSYNGVRKHKENMLLANNCSSVHELIGKYYMQGQLERHNDVSDAEHE